MSKREHFRQHQEAIWAEIAKILGGDFVNLEDLKHDKVIAKVDNWHITLDIGTEAGLRHEHSYLRMRAPYHNADGFRFALYHATIFDKIGALFGSDDFATGFAEFDKNFVLKTNNELKAEQLFSNPVLRKLLIENSNIYLHVRNDDGWFSDQFPEDVDELMLRVDHVPESLNKLMTYYEIFAETLSTLCHIGSAYEDDPEIELN